MPVAVVIMSCGTLSGTRCSSFRNSRRIRRNIVVLLLVVFEIVAVALYVVVACPSYPPSYEPST